MEEVVKSKAEFFDREKVGKIVCILGPSGSGKSTLAKKVAGGAIVLDGDVVRKWVTYDLGFSQADRKTNNIRIADIAALLAKQGYNVVISTIRADIAYKRLVELGFTPQLIDLNFLPEGKKPEFIYSQNIMLDLGKKWNAIGISKNGVSLLKATSHWVKTGEWVSDENKIHLVAECMTIEVDPNKKLMAVWRDPVERFLSSYNKKNVLERLGKEDMPLEDYINYAETQLKMRSGLFIDEHIRPQNQIYNINDIDVLVDIDCLDDWLVEEKILPRKMHRINESTDHVEATKEQIERIKALYKADYDMLEGYKGERYHKENDYQI